ncbi:hypothetical protein [Tenacibaculum piscium]|uniref:hypothetical protein n=1 Tax=Tenacibaculum piscium TaxID=1458515 RepID=UPI001F48FA4B|nr:hypothetical protein [Tenacibaculum piscium]
MNTPYNIIGFTKNLEVAKQRILLKKEQLKPSINNGVASVNFEISKLKTGIFIVKYKIEHTVDMKQKLQLMFD